MLTLKTQKVLAILHDIAMDCNTRTKNTKLEKEETLQLLLELEEINLIHLTNKNELIKGVSSFQVSRPLSDLSLLTVLEGIHEYLDCNSTITAEFYNRYGTVARKLGVINRMTRIYLDEIKVGDL